jgi:hypothetical protein
LRAASADRGAKSPQIVAADDPAGRVSLLNEVNCEAIGRAAEEPESVAAAIPSATKASSGRMEHTELFVDMVAQVDPSSAGLERMS